MAVVALAVLLVAAVFVRLGFWQLDRLEQRRQRNDVLRARLAEPVAPFAQLRDTIGYRRATVVGEPDYERELVLTGRSRQGSPGVYVATPVRRSGSDTAVVVIRGWVYAPDAATIDNGQWRESRTSFSGYVNALPSGNASTSTAGSRRLRTLSFDGVARQLPYPVARLYLVAQDSGTPQSPARLPPPALNTGPHLSYAIQWFSFATIVVIGTAVALWHEARRVRGPSGA